MAQAPLLEREALVRPTPPRPFVVAGRHAEAAESLVVVCPGVRQGIAGDLAGWHGKCPSKADADEVSAAAIGNGPVPAPETRWSSQGAGVVFFDWRAARRPSKYNPFERDHFAYVGAARRRDQVQGDRRQGPSGSTCSSRPAAMSSYTVNSGWIAALDAWFERVARAVHAFGGEVLKFIGDGVLAIFPVTGAPAAACEAALRAVVAARAGMTPLDAVRQAQRLPPLPFGAALHLGEMLWGNIGAADRLDFTAIGPAVNLVSRLEGLCRPLGRSVLISGSVAAETTTPLCR